MSKIRNTNFISLLLSLVLAACFLISGMNGYRILTKKAKDQNAVTQNIERWKSSYQALAGTEEKWKKTYRAASSVPDFLTLISIIDLQKHGVRTNTDTLILKTTSAVTSNNIQLNLTKVCLATAESNFIVEANNYDALLKGLDQLAHRQDLLIDNVSIVGEKNIPQAKIGDFCIYLRSE